VGKSAGLGALRRKKLSFVVVTTTHLATSVHLKPVQLTETLQVLYQLMKLNQVFGKQREVVCIEQ